MTYPTYQIPSINPQNIAVATPIFLQPVPRDPTAQDNVYPPGTEWFNTSIAPSSGTNHPQTFFKCVSSTIAGAVWASFIPNSAGSVSTLTGNSGGAVGPTGGGNISVVGDGTTITITGNPGTNTLTASLVAGSAAIETVTGNFGGPISPTAGNINILGGAGVSVSGSGSTLTIVVAGGGFTWNDVTGATQTIVVENGYVTNNGAGVTYTLPASAVEGNVFRIAGKTGIWTIAQNANQQILVGSAATSVGVLGTVVANNAGDCIECLCTTGGASTVWRALSTMGTLTLS